MSNITRYMDLRIKPIPRRCPIPPNSVAYIGGTHPDIDDNAGTTFILCKNKHEIVIEGPPLEHSSELKDMDEYSRFMLLTKMHADYLAIIEDLLQTIEFENSRWAHLVPDSSSGYQIILDRNKQLRTVSCPIRVPKIHIDQVEITAWGSFCDRRGIWNGKEVDVMYASDNIDMWRVNRALISLHRLEGQDFTFELYGTLVDGDGQIIGIVSEAARGRPIGPSDKELVFSEIRRLESHNCIYRCCLNNQFLIADGKLRLIDLVGIKPSRDIDSEKMRRDAELFHTRDLETLFQEFDDFGSYGFFRLPPAYLTNSYQDITYLRHTIPRPIRAPGSMAMIFLHSFPRSGYVIRDNGDEDDNSKAGAPFVACRRPQRRENPRLVYARISSRGSRPTQCDDPPLALGSLRTRTRMPGHPYAHMHSERLRLLTNSECTESTIDTIE